MRKLALALILVQTSHLLAATPNPAGFPMTIHINVTGISAIGTPAPAATNS